MKLKYEICPLYEACQYLSERFTSNRTADRIKDIKGYSKKTISADLPFFEKIEMLQKELDDTFIPDEIMLRYFTPMKTNEKLPGNNSVTLGGMLLMPPGELDESADFDDLVELYHSWSKAFLYEHFYTNSLSGFFSDSKELNSEMAGMVSAADKLLTNLEDKWALIDAATNPFPHLERLRDLVISVTEYIKKRSLEFEDELKKCLAEVRSYGDDKKILSSLLRFDLLPEEAEIVVYYQSLLSFNAASLSTSTHYFSSAVGNGGTAVPTGDKKVRLIVGVYIASVARSGDDTENPEVHLYLLKLIADPMRFNVLHDMCDKYTYGLELADKYKTTRSAMYYHLEKLTGHGLIDLKSTEYRMLYTMNKQNVYDKLNAMRDYLLNGWKPEERD